MSGTWCGSSSRPTRQILPLALHEARPVLRSNGQFIFNVGDRIDHNEFADTVTQALATLFPTDPPRFLARVAHGYHDPSVIAEDLARGGFTWSPESTTLPARSRADSPCIPAVAYCQGTPLRSEIEARGPSRLVEATDTAANAIASRFGSDTVDGKIQAHIIAVEHSRSQQCARTFPSSRSLPAGSAILRRPVLSNVHESRRWLARPQRFFSCKDHKKRSARHKVAN